jgi:hypothetical protein
MTLAETCQQHWDGAIECRCGHGRLDLVDICGDAERLAVDRYCRECSDPPPRLL